jgi:hypothetical protein
VRTGSSSHGVHPRCVLPIAHGWRTDDSAGCSRQALAFDRDDSGNCASQPARPPALQRREAACAIASECPLLYGCGHSHGCPRRAKSGHWRSASPENSRGYRARSRALPGIECPLCEAPDALAHRGHDQRSAGAAAALRGGPRQGRCASLGVDPSWRCSPRRSRSVPAALRGSSALRRHLGPGRESRARPRVRHTGDRAFTEPGGPERPWVGRTRPGRTRGPARGSSWHQGRHRPSEPRRGSRAGGGPCPGRKSPFSRNRVQGTSGRNSSRPQIGIEHRRSVHFRGPRPGFPFN